MSIKTDDQVLVFVAAFDRTADALGRVIASCDADGFAGGIFDRFDFSVFVQLKQIAVRRAGSHSPSWCDAALGDFDEIDRIGGPADLDDCPLPAGSGGVFPPKDLGRSIGLGLQSVAAGFTDVGEAMPCFGDVDLGRDDTIEHDSADLVRRDRFDGDANATAVFVFGWCDRFDCRVANEAGQFNGTSRWISQRRFKADDAADRNDRAGYVVNADRRCISQVRSRAGTTGEPVAVRSVGRGEQSVVLGRRDAKLITWANASCQL